MVGILVKYGAIWVKYGKDMDRIWVEYELDVVSEQAKALCDFQSTIVLWLRGFEPPRERQCFSYVTHGEIR